jgi:HNH endonuclease
MLNIELPKNTVELLAIDYTPDHWPAPGTYKLLGIHIEKPWEGGAKYAGYSELLQRFHNVKKLLKPHEEEWVDCRCIAALVPTSDKDSFNLVINGIQICTTELKLSNLRKLNSIQTQITTCNAKIDGGGYLRDGRHRSYNIMLDLPEAKKDVFSLQRSKEKSQFKMKYGLQVIQDHFKKKFFTLFENRCFKCGIKERQPYKQEGPPVLCIDHHIPIILGGHLVPGNLVSLCRRCNNLKHDRPPEEFYTPEELEKLKPLLEKQRDILKFTFDRNYWQRDRKGYLISLGIEPQTVDELLNNPNHPDYIGPINSSKETSRMEITIDVSDLIETIIKNADRNKDERS